VGSNPTLSAIRFSLVFVKSLACRSAWSVATVTFRLGEMDWIASLPQPLWIFALACWVASLASPLHALRSVALVNGFAASLIALFLLHGASSPLIRISDSSSELESAAVILSAVWGVSALSVWVRNRYFSAKLFPKPVVVVTALLAVLGYVYLVKAGPQAFEQAVRTTAPWAR
jgi:hypothetical protein